jgi:hypothetical protein
MRPDIRPALARAGERARAARRHGDDALALEIERRAVVLERVAAYSLHCTQNGVVPLTLRFVEALSATVSALEATAERYQSGACPVHDAPSSGPVLRPPLPLRAPTAEEMEVSWERAVQAVVLRGQAQRSLERLMSVPPRRPGGAVEPHRPLG